MYLFVSMGLYITIMDSMQNILQQLSRSRRINQAQRTLWDWKVVSVDRFMLNLLIYFKFKFFYNFLNYFIAML